MLGIHRSGHQTLDQDTFAYDIVSGSKVERCAGKQSADAWFSNDGADEYEVVEHAMPAQKGEVLVMLYLTDVEMFENPFEGRKFEQRSFDAPNFARRSR